MHRAILGLCVSSLFVAIVAPAAANPYFTDLVSTLGGPNSQAFGINNQGQVVGNADYGTGPGQQHPFLWSSAAGMIDLGVLPGGGSGRAYAINDSGKVTGFTDNTDYDEAAFLWTPNTPNGNTGVMADLGGNTDSDWSWGMAINAAGFVGGDSEGGPSSPYGYNHVQQVIWTAPNTFINLYPKIYNVPPLNGGTFSPPQGITGINATQAVGWYGKSGGLGGLGGFVYTDPTGAFTGTSGTIAPLGFTYPLAINAGGTMIVGYDGDLAAGGYRRGFAQVGGSVISMGTLGDTTSWSEALAVNAGNQAVGWYSLSSYTGPYDAFIWDSTNGMRDLNTIFAPVLPAGFVLQEATGINDAGYICGYGTNAAGQTDAFLLKPLMPGDANLDGKVDINDLTIVLTQYNATGMAWTQGDFNGDGTVDINDLTIVLAHYNQSLGTSLGINAVPEPSTLVLIGVGIVSLVAFTWRRRRQAS